MERPIPSPRAAPVRIGSALTHSLPSPAGLTTQVGFIRLAHERNPNSGEPEFGGPSASQDVLRRRWIAGSSPAMTEERLWLPSLRRTETALGRNACLPRPSFI